MLRTLTRDLPLHRLRRLFKFGWLRGFLIVLALLAIPVAVWFGFPMTGVAVMATIWLRLTVIGVLAAFLLLFYGLRWRKRRRAAAALEESLVAVQPGDGKVLAERMQEALAKLKRSGGKTYLYDLPWYIIIGPPGAGKTTALRNSGIEFPGLDQMQDSAQGFGGTRNCDWWFAENAVLIDTAGRYTAQDSDTETDKASWSAFLNLLKRGRPDQPVNGVILAFSVEDMMTADTDALTRNAETVRARLAELHEVLRIDLPVYVLFTKADLIAGFREYFSSFSQSRRKSVWGVTYQTRDRAEETWKTVPSEFDTLLSRLSDEVIDRMNEEPDGISRIAIFGLPGQMAILRDGVSEFLRRVFEPTRYKTNAILRGFYFTSGTQEGTPFDQVLGSMARESGTEAFQPAFMSGKGKSFFLHDLLKKVIFEERDWVGYDRRAVRRMTVLRSTALGLLTVATLTLMAALVNSFWQNATLVRDSQSGAMAFADSARNELAQGIITDPDPSLVLHALQDLRQIAAGYGDPREATLWEGFGLSRHQEMASAANRAYSDGLERMLRPRMILYLENELPRAILTGDTGAVYRALKVYLVLGGQGESGMVANDDAAVLSYFDAVYRDMFSGAGQFEVREGLMNHVTAMLELDGDRQPLVEIDAEIVRQARESIVNLPLAEQAYASIRDRAGLAGPRDFNLASELGGAATQILATTNGQPLDSLQVPALYTFEGYWGFFLEELTSARDRLEEDRWVLGPAAERVNYESQLQGLERELHRVYRIEFAEAWRTMLSQLTLAPMSSDPPEFQAMASAGSAVASPLLTLVELVDRETRLTRLYDEIAELSPEDIANPAGLGDRMGDAAMQRVYSRSGVFQRVVLDSLSDQTKNQARPGGAAPEDDQRAQVERITNDFAIWHDLLGGTAGERPIDLVLANLRDVRDNRRNAARAPSPADETLLSQYLSTLTMNNTAFPAEIAGFLNQVEREFRSVAQDATMTQLSRALNDDVTQFCREFIQPMFPFGTGRQISPSVFGQFFGPGGRMDSFFTTYLQPHVQRGPEGLQPLSDSAIGSRLSPATLRQFNNAQAIRLAFFASGSSEPRVDMSVTHVSSSPSVQQSLLSVHGTVVRTMPDSSPAALSWPGPASGMSVQLFPEDDGRASLLTLSDGRWDIVAFLKRGRTRVTGNSAETSFDIGGRTITYRFEFDSTTVPFLMPELSDFSCPASLE
ncbi:MAG: type VI secretion system membrane subunit TssM [Loktanella sp.]|nr:type VI secretion system membrane subunit TssM [Loktanella sp.]